MRVVDGDAARALETAGQRTQYMALSSRATPSMEAMVLEATAVGLPPFLSSRMKVLALSICEAR
jgi:hypothetical protein